MHAVFCPPVLKNTVIVHVTVVSHAVICEIVVSYCSIHCMPSHTVGFAGLHRNSQIIFTSKLQFSAGFGMRVHTADFVTSCVHSFDRDITPYFLAVHLLYTGNHERACCPHVKFQPYLQLCLITFDLPLIIIEIAMIPLPALNVNNTITFTLWLIEFFVFSSILALFTFEWRPFVIEWFSYFLLPSEVLNLIDIFLLIFLAAFVFLLTTFELLTLDMFCLFWIFSGIVAPFSNDCHFLKLFDNVILLLVIFDLLTLANIQWASLKLLNELGRFAIVIEVLTVSAFQWRLLGSLSSSTFLYCSVFKLPYLSEWLINWIFWPLIKVLRTDTLFANSSLIFPKSSDER